MDQRHFFDLRKQTMANSDSNDPVLYRVDDRIATITLNRPQALNAMTDSLMSGLSEALARVDADEAVRVVVLTGNGRGFCAGADLAQVANPEPAPAAPAGNSMGDVFNQAMRAIENCPVPTIARVNGAAAGGGFGLSLACDITIAARSAFFVATFGPRLGIVPDLGTTWNLPNRAGRARALGLALLGQRITAEQALDWGLIWSCVKDDQLDTEVERVASILKCSSPDAAVRIRHSIDAAARNTFSEQLDLEMEHQAVLIPKNMMEGALAFMEKREPEFSADRGQDEHPEQR
tara:strand:+ start:1225 stop:2097 length:873 start_codon:yes stop_codon:yes gene_type:complete